MKVTWRYLAVVAVLWAVVVVILLNGDPAKGDSIGKRETGYGLIRFAGKGPEFWHYRFRVEQRKLRAAHQRIVRLERRRARAFRRDVGYALSLASSLYGVSLAELRSVSWCESHHNPFARNRTSDASGLFQFLPSTWRDQGVAGHSVWDPVANALGAARIVARQGWRQWSCKP